MTKKRESIRNYKSSDSKLIQRFDNMHNAALRDLKHLEAFGFKKEEFKEMVKLRNKFSDMPSDIEVKSEKLTTTELKTIAYNELFEAVEPVLDRIGLHFGKESIQVKEAGGKALTKIPDADFCYKGKQVERTGQKYLEQLKGVGLTEEMLEDLKTKIEIFDDLIDKQKETSTDRGVKTHERIELGNKVYASCVRLNDVATVALKNEDPILLEDYRLTDIQKKKNGADANDEDIDDDKIENSDNTEEGLE